MCKKIIVYPAGKWARELLTLERAEKVDYFIDEDVSKQMEGFALSSGIKPIYALNILQSEDIESIIVIISDSKKYDECKCKLETYGLKENRHFFNGWKLDINFYRCFENHKEWVSFETDNNIDFSKYELRTRIMSSLIPEDVQSIMDLGCADEKLKKYLKGEVKYYGVDCVQRTEDTIICDVNNERIPEIEVDAYYMCGFLPYVTDVAKLFSQMKMAKYLVFSVENYDMFRLDAVVGKRFGFVINERTDYLFLPEIINCLWENGFVIKKTIFEWKERNVILCLAVNMLKINETK